AGDAVIGMLVSVDTKSRTATALTQSQIHGLFGADVLPAGKRTALMRPFTYRKVENAYETATGRDFLAGASEQLRHDGANRARAAGTQYLIAGQIMDVQMTRAANPNYKAPQKAPADDNLSKQLFRGLEKKVNQSVDGALDRNTDAQFLRTYNVDVEVEITK